MLFLNRDNSVSAIRRTPMTKSRRTASTSPAQRITAAIIEKLEQGTKPWVKPWRGVPDGESDTMRPRQSELSFFK